MSTSRSLLPVLVLALLLAVVLTVIFMDHKRDQRTVHFGAASTTGNVALVCSYGQEKGIFEKYDLNVSFVRFGDAYAETLSVLTGSADAIGPSAGMAANAYLQGENVSIGMALGEATNLMLIAKPEYASIEALRGRRIGVMGRTSDSYNVIKWYLASKGMDIETDVEIVTIAKPPALVTSFETGTTDAVVVFSGHAAELLSLGGVKIIDCSTASREVFGHASYSGVVLMSRGFTERRDLANDFLRAVREVAAEIRANPEEAIRVHAELSGEPVEKVRAVMGMVTLVGELDQNIKDDLLAFGDYAASHGYFEEAFGEDIFYDDWR